MDKRKLKLDLETKVDLVLLAIGMFLLVWVVVSHEEFRKGYTQLQDVKTTYVEAAEVVDNLANEEVARRTEEQVVAVISQELALNDSNLRILSQSEFDNCIIATFMYEADGESYEGICQISHKGEILFKAVDKINKEEPFTLHEVEFRKENLPSYNVIYGVINTPIIKSVNINFNDDSMVNIILGDSINYSYIDETGGPTVIRVDGLDEDLNIFYKWDKIYMKPI